MKSLLLFCVVIMSPLTQANNLCTKWENNPDYVKAINVVANLEDFTYDQLCTRFNILDIEAQPSRVILRDGEVIPHVRIQLHMEYSSCLYMISKKDWSVTKNYCYSGT